MKVVVRIKNLNETVDIMANDDTNVLYFNNKLIECDAREFIGNLCVIVANWEEKYINNSIIDGESFYILQNAGDRIREINGKNAFPSNYSDLKSLIWSIRR